MTNDEKERVTSVGWRVSGVSSFPLLAAVALFLAAGVAGADSPAIEVWHGDVQRIGHLGDAQDDFNLMGHVQPWRDVDSLTWTLVGGGMSAVPLNFRRNRRLANDGDFNADIPIGRLQTGPNTIVLSARFRDGTETERRITLVKETGRTPFPHSIRWSELSDPQDAGQYVDGKWRLTPEGLRTAQVGYDRVFLIGERTWRDYRVRTSITVHELAEHRPFGGANGVGLIARFAGHVTGGPLHFPSGQPKWGYLPFGAIGWLRWTNGTGQPPLLHAFPGHGPPVTRFGAFDLFRVGENYAILFDCRTLPDEPDGSGVTAYRFKIWPAALREPETWTWEFVQTSEHALRTGGIALLAHHVDVTFGDVAITLP